MKVKVNISNVQLDILFDIGLVNERTYIMFLFQKWGVRRMFLLKIWSGKEIKFTQGLSEHAAFWGKFRAMFPKFIKFEQVQKLKDI